MHNRFFFFSSRRRQTRCLSDWSSDVCSSDLWTLARQVAGGDIAARCPYQRLVGPTSILYPRTMEIPRRKTLPHEIPSWVDPQKEVYFITIDCEDRKSVV